MVQGESNDKVEKQSFYNFGIAEPKFILCKGENKISFPIAVPILLAFLFVVLFRRFPCHFRDRLTFPSDPLLFPFISIPVDTIRIPLRLFHAITSPLQG